MKMIKQVNFHYYFGELFDKPYIGENARELTTVDMQKAVRINRTAEMLAIILIIAVYIITNCMNVQCSIFNVQ